MRISILWGKYSVNKAAFESLLVSRYNC